MILNVFLIAYRVIIMITVFSAYMTSKQAVGSIGIIGGADGPTSIYVAARLPAELVLPHCLILLALLFFEAVFFVNLKNMPKPENDK